MAALKRKGAPGENPPAKVAKTKSDARPTKGSLDDVVKNGKVGQTAPVKQSTLIIPAGNSIITERTDDIPMFPRGGGSILSHFELKKIQKQAWTDAKAEVELSTDKAKTSTTFKSSRRSILHTKNKRKTDTAEEWGLTITIKIESLNFKKLVKGSLVLAQIIQIMPLELVLALPNNLVGYVSIVAVSDQITERLKTETAADDDENQSEDGVTDSKVDLKVMFRRGQYVRAYVQSTEEEGAASKLKRRIALSLRPADSNTGLSLTTIEKNCTIMASVSSVQDHGYIMDIGVASGKTQGFLPTAHVDAQAFNVPLQAGTVFLCSVTGKSSNDTILQLSTLATNLGGAAEAPPEATSIDSFLPGTLAEVVITTISNRGLIGKVVGHLDATADVIHSGVGPYQVDLSARYKLGQKIKARVICNFLENMEPKFGISLLPHILTLSSPATGNSSVRTDPTGVIPVSSVVDQCIVRHVEDGIGLFVDVGVPGLCGFVHISRVKDGKVDLLLQSSGPYQVGSVHRGRVTSYNPVDGLLSISFEQTVLDREYLRLDDIPVGTVVSGEIEKLIIDQDGLSGLLVKIYEGITGFVVNKHFSDIQLKHPEKKFHEGMKVKARVLSVDPVKRRMRLTLKKTLVNSEAPVISTMEEAKVGMQVLGTIVSLKQSGAHIRFYGDLTGFLPLSQMSEAFIRDPTEHFRLGQVISVHIIQVDPAINKFVVSCMNPAAFGLEKQTAFNTISIGDMKAATIMEITLEDISVELTETALKAIIPINHLSDRSASNNQSASKRLRVGQVLSDLMVLAKDQSRHLITLTQKPSLIDAYRDGKLLSDLDSAIEGAIVPGYVRRITPTGVLIGFGGDVKGLLPASRLPQKRKEVKDFDLQDAQTLLVRIRAVDRERKHMLLLLASEGDQDAGAVVKNMDGQVSKAGEMNDISIGRIVEVCIQSIKAMQVNVRVADKSQGRIDVSSMFDAMEEIRNPKWPLRTFHSGQTLQARVIGTHDVKNHCFLPFSHRSKHSIWELSARPSDLGAGDAVLPSLEKLLVGSTHLAFVNNIAPECAWVNLSPVVRGRILMTELSDDVSKLQDLGKHFPVGSALRVRVLSVDAEKGRLDLTCRLSSDSASIINWQSIKQDMTLPGRVTKINDRQVFVELSSTVSGPIFLPDLGDNFEEVNTSKYSKNEIIRVSVVNVDVSNKKIRLSVRPSRIMSSDLPVVDREIIELSQLTLGDILRGFVKHVSDKGVFVLLGGPVTAMVKISNLSDQFLKDWKDDFQVDMLVKGRIVGLDLASGQVEMSLRASVVDRDYFPLKSYSGLREGEVVTGKIRKVFDYGAFMVVDGSENVSGLCHKSQMADVPVEDATKLYSEGDVVKAFILKLDVEKKRISFGLKPSLFDDADTDLSDGEDGGVRLNLPGDSDSNDDGGLEEDANCEDLSDAQSQSPLVDSSRIGGDIQMADSAADGIGAMFQGKYDWTTLPFDDEPREVAGGNGGEAAAVERPRKRKAQIQVDRTAELDINGPQTVADYERLLLGQPDSSALWIAYVAFQMQVSDLAKARETAERAIRTISVREETEKLNVWIAFLNLEVTYGTPATVDDLFARACQYNDDQEVHERLGSIYIQSGKHAAAETVFESMVKKFGSKSPNVWINYAHFLHVTTSQPPRARALLKRATQALDERHHLTVLTRFAALEFRSPNGEPERGRTMFEDLLATFPKKGDLWNQLLDLEIGVGSAAPGGDAAQTTGVQAVRDVFERRTRVKGLKPQQAMKWFRRWADWEAKVAGPDGRAKVLARTQAWVTAFKAKKEGRATGQ